MFLGFEEVENWLDGRISGSCLVFFFFFNCFRACFLSLFLFLEFWKMKSLGVVA